MIPCHWVELDGTAILLDARSGDYLALGPADSEIWRKLISRPAPDPSDPATENLRVTAEKFGLLDAPLMPLPARAAARRPGLLRAVWCILRAAVTLRLRGFLPAYRWANAAQASQAWQASRASQAEPAAPPATADAVPTAIGVFLRAEHLFFSPFGPADCLPRSLALFAFLAGAGFPVRHVIGVQRYPFCAHAWVEHENAPLLQAPNAVKGFAPIAVLAA